MSCLATAAWTSVAVAAASAASSAYQSNKQGNRQKAAAREQREQAEKAAIQQDQDFNRANRKQADIMGLLTDATAGGLGATNLTGSDGLQNGIGPALGGVDKPLGA